MQWQDALAYGTPEILLRRELDEDTALQTLGEYPYSGKIHHAVQHVLARHAERKDEHRGDAPELFVLDTVVPIIMQAKEISYAKTMAALKEQKDKDDAADLAMIEDCMRDAKLAFKGPVSYARQGCRTSIIDKINEATD